MKILDKTYSTFAEVAERWNVTLDHIEQWVWEQHLLRAVIRLEGLNGFTGNTQEGWVEGNFHIRLRYLDNNDLVEKYSHKHVYVANPIPRDEKQNDLRNFYIKSAGTSLIVALGKSAEEVTHYEHEEHGLSKFMEDDHGNTLVWDIWMDTTSLKKAGAVFLQTPFFLWIEEVKSFEEKHPDLIPSLITAESPASSHPLAEFRLMEDLKFRELTLKLDTDNYMVTCEGRGLKIKVKLDVLGLMAKNAVKPNAEGTLLFKLTENHTPFPKSGVAGRLAKKLKDAFETTDTPIKKGRTIFTFRITKDDRAKQQAQYTQIPHNQKSEAEKWLEKNDPEHRHDDYADDDGQ